MMVACEKKILSQLEFSIQGTTKQFLLDSHYEVIRCVDIMPKRSQRNTAGLTTDVSRENCILLC